MDVKNYTLIEGKIPVLLSAPHVFAHMRPSLRGVLKQGEPFTDYFVSQVCAYTGAYGIALSQPSTEYDPNYHNLETNLYKQEIKRLVKEKKVKYVIDIHGLSNKHQYDVGIMYCMRFKKSKDLAYKLIDNLNKQKELRGISYYVGYNTKTLQESVTQFVAEKLKKTGLQIEIAQYIREDKTLLDAFIKGISLMIKSILNDNK